MSNNIMISITKKMMTELKQKAVESAAENGWDYDYALAWEVYGVAWWAGAHVGSKGRLRLPESHPFQGKQWPVTTG